MPLMRLVAEGVGPFRSLDIDFSDGRGNPHLGPHILAGVNGSGKSTVLRTIAWVCDGGRHGFPHDEWHELLRGHSFSRALVVMQFPEQGPVVWACAKQGPDDLAEWVRSAVPSVRGTAVTVRLPGYLHTVWMSGYGQEGQREGDLLNFAAYSPSKSLQHLASLDMASTLRSWGDNCLSFEGSVQNAAIQSWLLALYSKRAIARERKQSGEEYSRSLARFENALRLIYGNDVTFDVEIEPSFQPRLRVLGKSLNFSQLPDGVRSTVGWVADFMMRQDLAGSRWPGFVLLDEVDAHLHPIWQRRLLPSMREALPEVQIVATSHSPFVISSCPNSRVHVLELDSDGVAHTKPPVDSPVGESVMTTLKDIFGVESRFDILTERELNEWNELKRKDSAGVLSNGDGQRLEVLTLILSQRSEELRSIVAPARAVSPVALNSLLAPKKRKKA